jgi:hypothetical protein
VELAAVQFFLRDTAPERRLAYGDLAGNPPSNGDPVRPVAEVGEREQRALQRPVLLFPARVLRF